MNFAEFVGNSLPWRKNAISGGSLYGGSYPTFVMRDFKEFSDLRKGIPGMRTVTSDLGRRQ
jgi:hypothetical protein